MLLCSSHLPLGVPSSANNAAPFRASLALVKVARQEGWACHPCSFLLRDSVCVVSKLHIVISWKIIILEKYPVNLILYMSLKLKIAQNRGFLSCRVIKK